jgi:four helix bundle protein
MSQLSIDDLRLRIAECGFRIAECRLTTDAMDSGDLKDRTKRFALAVIKAVEALPGSVVTSVMGRQLIKCSTSVGANYRAACRARSRSDFLAKMGIVEEECDESVYWMEMLIESKKASQSDFSELISEGNELLSIVVSSIKTARSNR